MNYKSDWRIAFNTHHKSKHVKKMLQDFITNNSPHHVSSLIEEMLQLAICYESDSIFTMGGMSWKLDYWDELICVLYDMFDNDPEVDFASCRLGEDTDDNDIRNGDNTYLYLHREISKTDYDLVGSARLQDTQAKAKPKCECDIHQLMTSTGHDKDCPERKT